MRDQDTGTASDDGIDRVLDLLLRDRIQGGSCFIEYEDCRILQQDPRDRDPLLLPSGQFQAAIPYLCIDSFLLFLYKFIDVGLLQCLHHLILRRIGFGIKQILTDGAIEQIRLL